MLNTLATAFGHAAVTAFGHAAVTTFGHAAVTAFGHAAGSAPAWPGVLARWHLEPPVVAATLAAGGLYVLGMRRLAAQGERLRPRDTVLFGSGLSVAGLAVLSPIGAYAEALLWVHMVQHLLLVLVAAPMLAGCRCTPVLLAALPGILAAGLRALGRSPVARLGLHPVVSWVLFAATGWVVHFSPLFDAALRHPLAHAVEHGLFVATALLFWRPVVGRDPLSFPLRLVYVALAMPQNTFLALVIYSATHPLYDTYLRLERAWGPPPLDDQRLGAGLMWVAGDLSLLVAVLAVAGAWATASMTTEDDLPIRR